MSIAPPTPRPALRVTRVTPDLGEAVRALRVDDDQLPYVGDTAFNLAQSQADARSEAMAILADDVVVGFYRLDHAVQVVARALPSTDVALRAFVIDRVRQGQGLGTRAMVACCADLRQRHPDCGLLALNVHCSNVAAVRAYRNAGFVDTGKFVSGGRAGAQHFMIRRMR